MVHGHEETERCPIYVGLRFWSILCVIVGKINNMLLCVQIMFINTCLTY